jgi:hypothetical protein
MTTSIAFKIKILYGWCWRKNPPYQSKSQATADKTVFADDLQLNLSKRYARKVQTGIERQFSPKRIVSSAGVV